MQFPCHAGAAQRRIHGAADASVVAAPHRAGAASDPPRNRLGMRPFRPGAAASRCPSVVPSGRVEINSVMLSNADSSFAGPSRRALWAELAVLAALAAAFLVVFDTRAGYIDLALALAAVGLILLGGARSRALWSRHPVAETPAVRLRRAAVAAASFTAGALVVLAAIGGALAFRDAGLDDAVARLANPRLLVASLLYLPWAWLQQFVFQFYLLGRLLALLPVGAAVPLTAAAFAAVHYPRAPVMAVTLVAGAVWALLYRRFRSLVPLAVSHALLGAALHYWVFGRDLVALWLGSS